jgi:AcrR family transcriptional regulator
MTKGRPRSFDRDDVLKRAMMLFWKHGYDATSVSLLTNAMGIGAPSLYAAFGDKRALFKEALDYYMKNYGAFTVRALEDESDPRAAIERFLLEAAAAFTSGDHPPGCMIITAATNCAPDSAAVEKRLRSFRAYTVRALEKKIASGPRGVPADAARTLALFFSVTLQGMSAQARDGASREELEAVARAALRAWPP